MPAVARLTIACAVVAALLLPACDSSDTGPTGPNRETAKTAPREPFLRPQRAAKPDGERWRHRPPGGALCQSQIGGFIGSMDSLRRRLAVGVTYDQYVDEIHGVRSTYREVPAGRLRLDCVDTVGIPAEKAFNRYIEAANDWGDCVSELGCGSATIEPVLQQRWRVASHLLSDAQEGLRSAS